ncbi:TetR/AcrR family transcriptional regulator [Persicimonas caeni]|uniref:TetR/AcrR family transcriptional regulator n=1 Tax=Persicimonas caeni TaxID=2292766 RepID=A0A4Y6PYU5_PERCE|nr:TetR/AcrR family transcriptional regulator [Persicimonas caeni]QDG53433.1 TetR/AcrR family transcriptional regulator [Persicimonas caeni]QED34654.1 TetR/AcrR family transcriptional regulator [Persicimonas caeni]
MASRKEQKRMTREAILDAALEEFEEVGFEDATLRSIAGRADISAGSIIHHFGDKRQLLHAALFADLEETMAAALEAPGEGPLVEQLMQLTRVVFGYYRRRPDLSRTLLKESLFAEPPWAQRFAGQVAQIHAKIAQLAQGAIERGELRADTDIALLGMSYFSFFYFALISWVQGAYEHPVALVERQLIQHLDGLRP